MAACVAANPDVDDPEAYCATIMRETEDSCAGAASGGHAMAGQRWQGTIAVEGELREVENRDDDGKYVGDGRMIERGALFWDDDPMPLIWDRQDGDHTGPVVGQVERVWRDGDEVMAEGVLHTESDDEDTRTAAMRVAELITPGDDGRPPAVGVSVGLDSTDIEVRVDREALERDEAMIDAMLGDGPPPDQEVSEDGRVIVAKWSTADALEVLTAGRVRHVAVVDTASLSPAKIALAAGIGVDGAAVTVVLMAEAIVAAVAADHRDAFRDPAFGVSDSDDGRLVLQRPERPGETALYGAPLTVTDDGRVYGHAALWGRCHAGFSDRCVTAPRGGDYARFLSGQAVPGVATGPITVGTTHAKLVATMTPQQVMDHYSDSGRAVADVSIGEDRHGVWFAGRLRPGAADDDIAALRGSSLSGDWRMLGGQWRLCGLLAVNNPGFLVQRTTRADALAAAAVITSGPCDCHPYAALAAALGDGQSSAAVMLVPTADDADRLAQDGYETADTLHLTVAFMGPADELGDDVRQAVLDRADTVAGGGPGVLAAQAFAVASFNPEGDEPAEVLLVQDGDGALLDVRAAFSEYASADAHPVWFPHVTIGYDGDGDLRQAMYGLVGDVAFDRLAVAFGDDVTMLDLASGDTTDDDEDMASDDADAGDGDASAGMDADADGVAQLRGRIEALEAREARRLLGEIDTPDPVSA